MLPVIDRDINAAKNMAYLATRQLAGGDRDPVFRDRGHQADANEAALQTEARSQDWQRIVFCMAVLHALHTACARWNAEPPPCFFGTSLA